MSYILNALRKSERERAALQPDTVTDRIDAHPTPERQSSVGIVIGLVALNAAILGYFLALAPGKTELAVQQTSAASDLALGTDKVSKPAKMLTVPKNAVTETISPVTTAPAADRPADKGKRPIEPAKTTAELPQPPQRNITAQPESAVDANLVARSENQAKALAQTVAPPPGGGMVSPAVSATPVRSKDRLTTVDELPADVRRALPNLPINVLSYSPNPAERFVMIDMVKYLPGQMIKDQLELKAVEEDGIVVDYDGRIFKINRQ